MSDKQLVVLSLADEETARSLVRQLDAIAKLDDNVRIVDVAIAFKNRRGRPKLKQMKLPARGGLAGAIGGAFSGLASIYRDAGIDDDMMRRTAEELTAGEVALFLLYTGSWRRSSVVLQDALTAHGIRYIEPRHRDLARIRPAPARHSAAPAPASPAATLLEEPVEPDLELEPAFTEEPEPVFDGDSVAEFGDEDSEPLDILPMDEPHSDPVAEATRAALIAAAAREALVADAEAYAQDEGALSELTATAGVSDMLQGEAMIDASAQVSVASARVSLLSLERKYGGLEIGRIAGELAQISREVGENEMPLLAALLANRSGILQRISAEMVASAATARELASILKTTGGQVGELGAAEVDEGLDRLAAAGILAAQAADLGASALALKRHTASQ